MSKPLSERQAYSRLLRLRHAVRGVVIPLLAPSELKEHNRKLKRIKQLERMEAA